MKKLLRKTNIRKVPSSSTCNVTPFLDIGDTLTGKKTPKRMNTKNCVRFSKLNPKEPTTNNSL